MMSSMSMQASFTRCLGLGFEKTYKFALVKTLF